MASVNIVRVAVVVVVVAVVLIGVAVAIVMMSSADTSSSDAMGSRVNKSLKFVVVITRHGNRVPAVDYVGDPYPLSDKKFWPYSIDSLTPKGRLQMYNIGKRIRSLYNGFLNSTFYSEDFHGSSTYHDRLLMSGEAFLAGLYPPKGFQIWNKNIPWQPTPLYSDSQDHTLVINYCPRYTSELLAVNETFVKDNAEEITELITLYNQERGSNNSIVPDLYYLWDKISCEDSEGFALPQWTRSLYPAKLMEFIKKMYVVFYAGNEEIIRLVIGNFYEQMMSVMTSKAKSTLSPDSKLYYYSAHDSSIVALRVLLGISNSTIVVVKPASALIFELHQDQTSAQFSVQALYVDGVSMDGDPVRVDIPNCGDPCDLWTLVNNTQNYFGVEYDQECQTNSSPIAI